jgi:predicted RNA binding protein YcfA (HicA-like mRNA interferase family)
MTGKQFIKLLKKNDWKLAGIKGSHHKMTKGGLSLSVPVHSNKDLKKGTLNQLLKDAGLK